VSVAAIILAAGAATRMGRLKQLLPFRGKTLMEHAVAEAREADFHPIVVVLGADSQAVRNVLTTLDVLIVENSRWQSGMGSSIAAGVEYLEASGADADAAAILLADQPLVTAGHLKQMARLMLQSPAAVIAAHYGGTVGVPALFRRYLFPQLISLPAEAGARSLLRDSKLQVTPFDLPEAATDIDTPDDFAALAR
jgi:molybdenum cofactor cytidylyltransferase